MAPMIMNPFRFGSEAGIGGWVELARTTLGGAETSITVSSLDNKRYYMVLCPITAHVAGGTDSNWRFNSDSGSNYAYRMSANGSESTGTNKDQIFDNGSGGSRLQYSVSYIANLAGKEKLMMTDNVVNWVSGASGDIFRKNIVGKWDNTSNAINSITNHFLDGGGIANDELIVLGWDPADEHTTNFWEELASVDLAGGVSDTLSSGTFAAKKYLWVQCYLKSNSTTPTSKIRVGNGTVDSGTNYFERYSVDGGADGTVGSIDELDAGVNIDTGESEFHNMFIINRSAQDKLMIHHRVGNNLGTGDSNAPSRRENVFKWANTSNQINILQFKADSGTYTTNSILKVWGSD